MKKIIHLCFLLICYCTAQAQNEKKDYKITGWVRSMDGAPLIGATVKVKGATNLAITNTEGQFSIFTPNETVTFIVSFVGYKNKELTYQISALQPIVITLENDASELKEVVVSTGYQTLPKERATGSFVQIDNEMVNRRVGTDILSRLEDITSGLIFNRAGPSGNPISIRGQSTIYANANPLIVIDNFPYDGDINNINPNDVESITVLKDASAASIWGARAGNGVIVITTKQGGYNRPIQVSFNSNITIGDKPNLFYQSQMSSADFISVEKMLFNKGFYQSAEASPYHAPLTPVVDLLIAARDGTISTTNADAQINALTQQDVRNDFTKYFYQKSTNQQYALNINGGSANEKYYVSAGYDKNADNLVANWYSRLTLNAANTYSMLKQKLQLSIGLNIIQSNTTTNNPGYNGITMSDGVPLYPYAKLADASGNPLAVVKDYRYAYAQSAQQQGLLNWLYQPLAELRNADNTSKISDYRINTGIKYSILPQLNAELLYQYDHSVTNGRNLQNADSYYARNLINQFTQVNTDGSLTRNIPLGGILDLNNQSYTGQNFRGQLNYEQLFNTKHEINAIAGYEVKDLHTIGYVNRLYGYDDDHAISQPVNYISNFNLYYYPGATSQIPFRETQSDLTDRYLSYYTNAAYTYDKRYTLSASARLDESNLFGVKANQKGVPLWSAGLAWNINEESFYKIKWLPYLKLRATYGYNGNVYKNVSAYTTASYIGISSGTQLPYSQIKNPPNPQLRWEMFQVINLGLDFNTKNSVIGGSIEYYHKKGIDLIGTTPYAPSTGISNFTGNYAGTTGNGIDITLNTRNIDKAFKWYTSFLFSYIQDKVTEYNIVPTGLPGTGVPVIGKPLYAIYSYKWAGLDPQTGDPQGYLNGQISKDYTTILSTANAQNSIYNGSARPTRFGAFRNTFSWKNISVSANISYRFGYYFRKPSVNYITVLSGQGGSGDYALRWQKPGDEAFTQVPSMPTAINSSREYFYQGSEVLVVKGDNIRFQDIRLSYELNKGMIHNFPFKHVQVYGYCNNLGIIWKAAKGTIDPDYSSAVYTPVRTIAAGIKADF